MLYPQYFIDDLKGRADIVRIIQSHVDLKKKGSNWMGCCPFHDEKTPSFSVSPSKGFYKCFGCGKGGSVYNFLMEMEGLNFPEAVRRVAEISGAPLPEPVDDESYERQKEKKVQKKKVADEVIELNRTAMEFWQTELHKKNAHAKAARKYLEGRGISDETQSTFQIGYSPDSWDSLLNHLKKQGADEKLISESGLVSVNEEKERTFDRFRGRIMFPVLDASGRPVAFGARSLDPDDQPKYLNSPETPAYTKGEHLYGLFQARDEIRKKRFAILVEGYLDLIALYQFGITNVAASLGTAFTPDQAKLLGRFTKKVVINYDGDSAGIKAARRAIEHLLPADFEIKVLVLPNSQDPDDFVRESGADGYNAARGKAQPYLEFVLNSSVHERNIAIPRHKADAIEEVLPVISLVRNTIQKRETFDQAMNFFRIEDRALKNELWKAVKDGHAIEAKAVKTHVARATRIKATVAEIQLLELLVYDRDLRTLILPQLEESDYEALATAPIYRALYTLQDRKEEPSIENLFELTGEDENAHDLIPPLLMGEAKRSEGELIDHVLHEAENCVFTLRSMALENRVNTITQEILHAEQNGNGDLVNQLVLEKMEIGKIELQLRQKIREI